MRRRHILVPLALTILASPAVAAPAGAATGSLSSPTTPTGTGATFENPYSTDTGNNIVAFGDSFTSNSASYVNAAPQNYPTYPRTEGCLTAPDAWPAQLGAITRRPVQNWACNAHTTGRMLGRIDRAIASGHINDTSLVILAAGMNDKRQEVPDVEVVANLVSAVEKVRAVAPGAQIAISADWRPRTRRDVSATTTPCPTSRPEQSTEKPPTSRPRPRTTSGPPPHRQMSSSSTFGR